MHWSKCSEHDPVRDIAGWLDQAVTDIANRGYPKRYAVEQAALALGISPRKAKSTLYGEYVAFVADEYQSIKRRFLAHLDAEADQLGGPVGSGSRETQTNGVKHLKWRALLAIANWRWNQNLAAIDRWERWHRWLRRRV